MPARPELRGGLPRVATAAAAFATLAMPSVEIHAQKSLSEEINDHKIEIPTVERPFSGILLFRVEKLSYVDKRIPKLGREVIRAFDIFRSLRGSETFVQPEPMIHEVKKLPADSKTAAVGTFVISNMFMRIGSCESGGNNPTSPLVYSAQNPKSSASGAWQITDPTWNDYDGYVHAKDAPPEIQYQKAIELYDWYKSRGLFPYQPWVSSEYCWQED